MKTDLSPAEVFAQSFKEQMDRKGAKPPSRAQAMIVGASILVAIGALAFSSIEKAVVTYRYDQAANKSAFMETLSRRELSALHRTLEGRIADIEATMPGSTFDAEFMNEARATIDGQFSRGEITASQRRDRLNAAAHVAAN